MIARNEERFIAECLDSARAFVDEVIVLDTGSSDQTREVARAHGARVEVFSWCDDFSAARNAAVDLSTGDWIFMLDADERLDAASGPHLRSVIAAAPPSTHAIAPVIESRQLDDVGAATTTLNVPRLFPHRPDIRFVGAIHEIVTYLPNPRGTVLASAPSLRIIHYGYDLGIYQSRQKDARNIALLQKSVDQHPDDGRMLYFLLQQHYTGGRPAETVALFDQFLAHAAELPVTFVVEGFALYLAALTDLGDSTRVDAESARARKLGALGANALDVLAVHYLSAGRIEQAEKCCRELLESDLPRGLTIGEGLGGWATRLKLAQVREKAGHVDLALDELETAYADLPASKRAVVALQAIAFALRTNNIPAAHRWLERAHAVTGMSLESHERLLDLALAVHARGEWPGEGATAIERALARHDLEAAFECARAVRVDDVGAVLRLHATAVRLRAAGEHQAALVLLNRAIDGPPLPRVYSLLALTLADVGRYEEAAMALTMLHDTRTAA